MLSKLLKKTHIPVWLFVVLLLILVFRIPSFFEPYYYGDETIYLTLGEGIRQGVPLYKNLHDNKPPLLYIVAAVAGSIFWFKVILAGWMIATTYIFWKFVERMYPKKEKLHKVSVIIFAILTTIPLFEGNIANAELFMIGPTILAFYILLFNKLNVRNLLLSGMLFSVSTLFKMPALFDIGAIVAFFLIYLKISKKDLLLTLKNLVFIFVGFVIPILITVIWYAYRGALHEYLVAAFLQNLGYLSTWSGNTVKKAPFLVKNAALLIKFGFVILANFILYLKRRSLPKEFVFLVSWVLFSSFAVSLSERPYPHYFVQVIPAVSILFGLFFTDKTLVQSLSLIPLGIAFFVPFYYKFWYYPTTSYYARFVKLATGQLSKDGYLKSFNINVSRNYQIADVISKITKKTDKVFVWGESSQIYALSRRLPPIKYTADYHIKDFYSNDMVIKDLKTKPPTVIVILPESLPFPELKLFMVNKYILLTEVDGAEIWKALTPEVQSAIIINSF
jgi:hypothetical protein